MIEFEMLVQIIETLRSDNGCPWDKEQTHETLLPYLYEETNEVADTIINMNYSNLQDELGDLLLQILLHSQIARENGQFTIEDVIKNLSSKLIRRHPHVFSDEKANNSDEVLKLWDDIKKIENKGKHKFLLDKVPYTFSPLLRAYKLQKEASKVGFDWEDFNGPISKIEEELKELKDAIKEGNKKEIENELGDLIFAIVNLGRFFNIRSEVALSKTNDKFKTRFNYIEEKVQNSNKDFKDFSLDELDEFWNEAKKILSNS